MCGIIGISEHNEKVIKDSCLCFQYRGPDATSFFSDSHVTLGHHRLAILDLDPRSTQPMSDEDKKIWIVFNGEIYNFKELKEQLVSKYHFRTTSDTEVLIYAYKEWGMEMTKYIQGMFALAIYDSKKQKVILLRDHAGIKPLYYYEKDGLLIFASELKGVVKTLKEKNLPLSINKRAIDLYTVMGYIPSPYTMYNEIAKLPKSSYLEFDLKAKTSNHTTYVPNSVEVTTFEDYSKLIEKKVLEHLIADVPVGVFFSGGTDSSLIATILHKHNINLETFSIGIDYKSDDKKYFKLISDHLKLKSHVYSFDIPELDSVYEEVMTKMDEPTYDNSIFPTYFVSKKAAEKVKVVLSGEGGDEYFYGYPRSFQLSKMKDRRDYSITCLIGFSLFYRHLKAKIIHLKRSFDCSNSR
jgi:asparagine synthase (glutamine-hydrolysing)